MSPIRTLLALSFPVFLVTGCPDAEGQYDEFKDRFNQLHPPGSGGEAGAAGSPGDAGGDAAVCAAPQPGEIDGDYLFALAAVLDDSKPIVFSAKVSTQAAGGGTQMHWVLQGLLWSDRKTPVGDPIDLPPFDLSADGAFDSVLPPLSIVGEANPFSHTPITAEVTLKGKFCGADTFFCGTASGNVTKPVPIPLDGSAWTLEKTSGGAYPEPPKINCKKKAALDVGTWK